MPALNFKERFAGDVESGRKRQTVRRMRKQPIKPGDRLTLYTGMRTKSCRQLGEVVCRQIDSIVITDGELVLVNGHTLTRPEKIVLAQADGFVSVGRFLDFFRQQYGLPFEGVIIKW